MPWQQEITDQSTAALFEGRLYTGSFVSRAVANNASVSVRVTAGLLTELLKIGFIGTGELQVDIYEGSTYSAAGTALTIQNRNLLSANSCAAAAHSNPTTSALGTYHYTRIIPAGSGQGQGGIRAGALSDDSYDFLMNPNSDLLFVITNISGAAADVNAVFTLSEMTS